MSDLRERPRFYKPSDGPAAPSEVADMVGLGAKMPFETIPRSEWYG